MAFHTVSQHGFEIVCHNLNLRQRRTATSMLFCGLRGTLELSGIPLEDSTESCPLTPQMFKWLLSGFA